MPLATSYHSASYRARLSDDFNAMIESKELNLTTLQRSYLRSRWLEQVLRMEYEAQRAMRRYQASRLITAVGSILILMLVSLDLGEQKLIAYPIALHYVPVFLALIVSVSVAVEHLHNYGERWREAEGALDRLKSEGWRFLQLSGHYRHYESHFDAFTAFANNIEDLTQREVEIYTSPVGGENRKRGDQEILEAPKKLEPPLKAEAQSSSARTSVRNVVSGRLSQSPPR